MRNKFRILIILVLISSSLFALGVSGIITDEEGSSIQNVLVSTENAVVFSDETGFFLVEKESGKILFHKIGFEDKIYTDNEQIPEVIILKISPVEIEGIITTKELYDTTSVRASETEILYPDFEKINSIEDLVSFSNSANSKGINLPGENSIVSILGNLPKHTLIMLDGIPLNADGQEFDISSIPVEIVGKIEVVKSSQGLNAGSGNIGGVINIVTGITYTIDSVPNYNEELREYAVSQVSGSFGLSKTSFTASYKNQLNKFFASISNLHAANDFEYKYYLTNEPETKKRENNVKSILDFNLSGQNNYQGGTGKIDVIYRNFHKGLPGPINELSKNNRAFIKGSNGKIIISYSKKSDNFLLKTNIYQFADKSVYDNTESSTAPAAFKDETKYFKTGFILKTEKDFIDFIKAGFGSEFNKQHYENKYNEDVIIADTNNYAFHTDVSLKGAEFPFTLLHNIGARLDINDSDIRTKNYQSGFLNASIEYESDVTIKTGGGVSAAYSLPSFYDLYWKGDSQAVGNPNLEAETATNKNLFLNLQYDIIEFKTSYNMQSVENLIYWYRSASFWTAGNIADAEINNFEMSLKLKPSEFITADISYLKTNATDKTKLETGEPANTYGRALTYVPEHKLRVYITAEFGKLQTSATYTNSGKQHTNRFNDNTMVDEYGLVDAYFSYLYENKVVNINFFVKLNNIFDEEYEEYLLVPRPGFNWQAGFKVNL